MTEDKNKDTIPTIMDYTEYLRLACINEGITKDEARNKYGKTTYGEWEIILKSYDKN